MTARNAAPRELRGWHVLTAMLLFFGAIIAINVAFSVVAVRSFPGEDERRSYLQGLRYNETLAERAAQKALGWQAGMVMTPQGADAQVKVRFTDRNGKPVDGLTVEGVLRRPATTRDDIPLIFRAQGDGVYTATPGAIAAGGWNFHGAATRDDARFELERRMTWTPPR